MSRRSLTPEPLTNGEGLPSYLKYNISLDLQRPGIFHEVAALLILMLDEETLINYVKRYQSGGIKALIATHYQGSVSKLSGIQLNKLNAHLEQNTYLTVEAIIAYVYEQYDVSYTVSGMTDLLHRLKFTYKKSKLVPAKADKKQQEQFLAQLEALKASKGKDDPILYMDGVHPQHNRALA